LHGRKKRISRGTVKWRNKRGEGGKKQTKVNERGIKRRSKEPHGVTSQKTPFFKELLSKVFHIKL
jgi:hypothetical protein